MKNIRYAIHLFIFRWDLHEPSRLYPLVFWFAGHQRSWENHNVQDADRRHPSLQWRGLPKWLQVRYLSPTTSLSNSSQLATQDSCSGGDGAVVFLFCSISRALLHSFSFCSIFYPPLYLWCSLVSSLQYSEPSWRLLSVSSTYFIPFDILTLYLLRFYFGFSRVKSLP